MLKPLVLADLVLGLEYIQMFAWAGHIDGSEYLGLKEGVVQRAPFARGRTLYVNVIGCRTVDTRAVNEIIGLQGDEANLVRAFTNTPTNNAYLRRLSINKRVDEYLRIIGVDVERGRAMLERFREVNRISVAQRAPQTLFYQ